MNKDDKGRTMSKELTEKWRKGTLKDGDYYVRREYDIIIDYYYNFKDRWEWTESEQDVKEVLTIVPTYTQFIELTEKVEELKQQLKEANKILFNVWGCREDREYYAELAKSYFEKYGAER